MSRNETVKYIQSEAMRINPEIKNKVRSGCVRQLATINCKITSEVKDYLRKVKNREEKPLHLENSEIPENCFEAVALLLYKTGESIEDTILFKDYKSFAMKAAKESDFGKNFAYHMLDAENLTNLDQRVFYSMKTASEYDSLCQGGF